MFIKAFFLLIFILIIFLLSTNFKKRTLLFTAKFSLQLGILLLFVGGFIKLFLILPSNSYIKFIFFIIYMWCTVGINVNFMIPLINLIDIEIGKDN